MVRHACALLAVLVAATAAARFHTVVRDQILRSHSLVEAASDICTCKTLCLVKLNCTAASFDIRASECYMTHDAPQNVTLKSQSGVISLLKFHRSSCDPIAANATIFITAAKTKNGTWQNQQRVCDGEAGEPLIIKTRQERADAVLAVAGVADSPFPEKYAWITAAWAVSKAEAGPLRWADRSEVADCAFDVDDFINFQDRHAASMVRDDDKLESSNFFTENTYSVLCKKSSGN